MINMEHWRACVESKCPFHADDVRRLLDEIERLRAVVEFQRVSLTKDIQRVSLTKDSEEYVKLREELDGLREQLRPRSIKDEPPPKDKYVLVLADGLLQWIAFMNPGTEYTHWLPMPPAPPQPDAFEEWAEAQPWWQDCGDFNRACVRDSWRAAIQSTKHEKTNPVG